MAPRPKIDFRTATAEQIVEGILSGTTTQTAFYQFRYRVGIPTANRQYPETLRAMALLKDVKYKLETARMIKGLVAPYNEHLASGVSVQKLIQPMIDDWRAQFFEMGVGLMDDQVTIAVMLLAADKLKEMRGE